MTTAETSASDNLRGAGWMTLAMAGYVVNDALIKRAAEGLPLFESIFLRGLFVTAILLVLNIRAGTLRGATRHLESSMLVRFGTEVLGTIFFLSALTRIDIAPLTAVLQVVPLVVTLAAALLLGEVVGWRRYVSIGIGFIGVLVVVRPGSESFNVWYVVGLLAVAMVVIRELATRRVKASAPSLVISLGTSVSITVMGAVVSIFEGWQTPTVEAWGFLALAAIFLSLGYTASIITIRTGDVSFTAPFRYTVLIFAIVLQIVVFGDVPDAATFVGAVIIASAGLYTFARERYLANFEVLTLK